MTQAPSQKSDHRHPGVNLFQIDDPGFMTQAPTPGPLDDAERYEQAKRDFNRMRDDGSLPAPTAPVEASGSEREHWSVLSDLHTIKGWLHGLSTAPDLTDVVADGGVSVGDCYQQEAREFAGRLGRVIEALRPQPSGFLATLTDEQREEALVYTGDDTHPQMSGETREAVARIIDGGLIHYGVDGIRIEDFDGKRLPEKYAGMEEASQALAQLRTDAILALLSARPLALGGQQGVPQKWVEVARYATERGLTVHESNMRMEEFRRVVTPTAVLSVAADEEVK